MFNKSTYTVGTLKDGVYKALGIYSADGQVLSVMSGVNADIEKKYISVLNMCIRRIALSFPLKEKKGEVVFEGGVSLLPDDCLRINGIFIEGKGEVSKEKFTVYENRLECSDIIDGTRGFVKYCVMPTEILPDTPCDKKINLPDITVDALIYLTASELCPAEYGELYSKLMFKYRDIALNCYNHDGEKKLRNSLFKASRKHGRTF